MAYPVDPYDPEGAIPPIGPWTGTWPPDASWDTPPPVVPATIPAPPAPDDGSPVPPGPYPGPPVDENAPAPPAPALPQEPPDAALITMGDDGSPPPGAPEPLDPALSYLPATSDLGAPAQGNAMPGQPPPPDAADIELEPGTPPAQPEESALTDDERVAGLQRIAETDPVKFADILQQHDDARVQEDAARRLKAAKDDADRAQQAWQTHVDAQAAAHQRTADLDAESDRLANEKVDPDGWRDSRSVFQKIAMYATAIVGGLIQGRQGGPNQGLAMIDNEIQRHIAAQQANLAHRRALLGDRRQSLAEQNAQEEHDYMQGEAFRQAAYKRTLDAIDADMQNYDPKGTAWLRRASLRAQVDGQLQQSRLVAGEKAYQQYTSTIDLAIKMQKADDEHAAAMRKLAGGIGGGIGVNKMKLTPEQLRAVLPAGSWIPPSGAPPMTIEEYGKLAEAGEKGRKAAEPTEGEKRGQELTIYGAAGALKQEDGYPFQAPTKESAEAIRTRVASARGVTSMIDETLDILNQSSVLDKSSWVNSDQYQRLKALQARITMLQKSGTQGMSSNEDMQKLADAVGAGDLTSFRDRAAGLKEGRARTVQELNDYLTSQGYSGKPIRIGNPYKAPVKTTDQRTVDSLVKSTAGQKKQSIPTVAVFSPVGAVARGAEFLARSESNTLTDKDQKAQVDVLIARAMGPNAGDASSALTALHAIQDRAGQAPALRTYIQSALKHAYGIRAQGDLAHRNPTGYIEDLKRSVIPAPDASIPAPEGDETAGPSRYEEM